MVNKANVLRVADAIEKGELVERGIGFNMQILMGRADAFTPDRIDSCGTVACIAGWSHAIRYPRRSMARLVNDYHATDDNGDTLTWGSAKVFLGLTWDEAEELFQPSNVGSYTALTPAHAVAVLRHLAETGEVDWSVKPQPQD